MFCIIVFYGFFIYTCKGHTTGEFIVFQIKKESIFYTNFVDISGAVFELKT